jgi:type VI protein secretion system component Hcp
MADEVRDALVRFVIGGKAIPAESAASIDKDDDLAKDYIAATETNNWASNFFQVKTFKMDMGLIGDTAGDPEAEARIEKEKREQMAQAIKSGEDELKLASVRSGSDFAAFMKASRGGALKSYSSNLENVVLTKSLDNASLSLFTACTACTLIDTVTLIKRRGGGGKKLLTYLRVVFEKVLITDFNWDEDDVITEKISFVCRSAKIKYRVEQSSGKLDPTLPEQSWTAETNLK